MIYKNIALSVLVGVVLTACGGGGGGSTPSSSGGSDLVSSTTPTDKATAVDTATKVTATFSEDMLGTSIDNSSFTLSTANGATSSSISFDGSTNVATLSPNASLGLLQTYNAKLTSSITNLSGAKIAEKNWSFTTRDGSWGTKEFIDSVDREASEPIIGVDGNGNVAALWSQTITGGNGGVRASHFTSSTGWSAPVFADAGNTTGKYQLQLAVSANGDAIAVWQYFGGDARYHLWANRYVSGTGWGTAEEVGNSAGSVQTSRAEISMNATGNAFVVWSEHDGTELSIYSNRYAVGSGWDTAGLIESTISSNASAPTIAMDAAGNALAVWRVGASKRLYYNNYTVGSGWQSENEFADLSSGTVPDIVMNANGKGALIWRNATGATISTRLYDGSNWGNVQSFNIGIFPAEQPKVAIDAVGNVVAAWHEANDDITNYLYSSRYSVGGGWSSPIAVDDNADSKAINDDLKISMDGNGNAMTVWTATVGGQSAIWSSRFVKGSGWGTAKTFGSAMGTFNNDIGVAAGVNGHIMSIWIDSNNSWDSIAVNRFE